MTEQTVKEQVRALLDRLPDDCSFADVQRAIAVLMWPIIAVVFVGTYGFAFWVYFILSGPPGPS